jgi:DNA-binding transcriptional regulator YdaS (Cro superfamily)
MLTEQEVMNRLRTAITAAGGQRQFAQTHGITPAYVNDVVHGRRALADRILAAIGVERTITYQVVYQDRDARNVAPDVAAPPPEGRGSPP